MADINDLLDHMDQLAEVDVSKIDDNIKALDERKAKLLRLRSLVVALLGKNDEMVWVEEEKPGISVVTIPKETSRPHGIVTPFEPPHGPGPLLEPGATFTNPPYKSTPVAESEIEVKQQEFKLEATPAAPAPKKPGRPPKKAVVVEPYEPYEPVVPKEDSWLKIKQLQVGNWLLKQGVLRLESIAQHVKVSNKEAKEILTHPWFERIEHGYRLTKEGKDELG